jgi:hypothetical protein
MNMEPRIFFPLFTLGLAVVVLMAISMFMAYRFKQRELIHRERMAALERGVPLPAIEYTKPAWRPTAYLLRGMMWLFSGVALLLFFLGVSRESARPLPPVEQAQMSIQLKGAGMSDSQIQNIVNQQRPGIPPGFAFIALIPVGVGLAYLLTYRKEQGLKTNA